MKKFSLHKIVFLVLICGCCIDPFNKSLPPNKTLVVDGLLTDQIGPQTVTLSYSSDLGVGEVTRVLASGAVVTIADNGGGQTQLREVSSGVYQTDSAYTAEPGKSYFLRISINNKIYESDTETLLPAGQFDSLFFKIESTPIENQFQIYANSSKPRQSNGLTRWRSSYIFQIVTEPSQHRDEGGNLAPWPCSGVTSNSPCVCCVCWVYGKNSGYVIANGSNFINNKYENNLIATIPIDDKRFQARYFLKVDQLSLSVNAYNFWNLVTNQQTGATSLFQPASARIQGNIHSMTDSNEQVLGLFQVSSLVSKSIFINRNDVPLNMQRNPTILDTNDCRMEGTDIRPSFW